MNDNNTIYNKTFKFATRIVKLYKFLCDNHKEYIISKQLLRCGASIGANVNEATSAQSKKDFISKMSIANKEARETKYLNKIKILTSIVKTSQENLKKEQNVKETHNSQLTI